MLDNLYGMVSAYESMYLAQRMPPGEVARMVLMGGAERIGARRAYETGPVSEVTAPGGALAAAVVCAEVVAGYPSAAVQGTVRAAQAGGFVQARTVVDRAREPPGRPPGGAVRRAAGRGVQGAVRGRTRGVRPGGPRVRCR